MSSNICIVTWFDDNVKEYAEITYIINKTYCDKYGYDIIKSNEKRTNLKPHWERIPLVLKYLDKYDYVIWIDSDAIFNKDSPPITNVIEENKEKLFIFSGDVNDVSDNCINSGFFIVKNSPLCFPILENWYTNYDITKNGDNRQHGYIEDQGGLRYMYEKNLYNLKNISVVIPYGILQSFPSYKRINKKNINIYGLTHKAFVVHLAGESNETRKKFFKLYLSYNYTNICACGIKKKIDNPACCFLCYKKKGHGPICQT
jgi:hypothetical protein